MARPGPTECAAPLEGAQQDQGPDASWEVAALEAWPGKGLCKAAVLEFLRLDWGPAEALPKAGHSEVL